MTSVSSRPRDVCGRIASIDLAAGATNPGAAAGITYTILVYVPTGGLAMVPGCRPVVRYAFIEALPVGTPVRGWIEAGTFYYWDFNEPLAGVDCQGNPISLLDTTPLGSGGGVGPPPPPPPIGSVGAGSTSAAPSPGGP